MRRHFTSVRSPAVLLVADLLHPIDDLPIELCLHGDMRHGSCRRRAMPVLFPTREPHHIARPNFLDWTALALRPAAAGCDKQGLTERMCVPRGAGSRLEGHARGERASRSICLEQWIDSHRAGEPVGGAFAVWLGTISF